MPKGPCDLRRRRPRIQNDHLTFRHQACGCRSDTKFFLRDVACLPVGSGPKNQTVSFYIVLFPLSIGNARLPLPPKRARAFHGGTRTRAGSGLPKSAFSDGHRFVTLKTTLALRAPH